MRTLKIEASANAYILKVFSNAGHTYYYGVFASRPDAIEFAKMECNGFRWETEPLILVDRI